MLWVDGIILYYVDKEYFEKGTKNNGEKKCREGTFLMIDKMCFSNFRKLCTGADLDPFCSFSCKQMSKLINFITEA